jgi:HlyD family secretion protein
MNNFSPTAFLKNGVDVYLVKHTTASNMIYIIVLLAITGALIALPFVYVDVSVQEMGYIRPVAEKSEISSSISERVDSIFVREGQLIAKGDTILTFRRSVPDYQITYQQKRLDDYREHLNDLLLLSKGDKPEKFSSSVRQQEYAFYMQQIRECETNLSKAEKDIARNRTLFEKNVIAAEEYEQYQYEYDKAQNVLKTLKDNQLKQWQNDRNNYSNLYDEMKAAMNQEIKSKDRYVVVSPVSGTLDQFRGIYEGSSILAGSMLAIISPDSTLCAEIFVSPRNIGYINIGMPVNIQVSSFNYNEWGIIAGKVTEISSDYLTDGSGNNVFYKVKCNMGKNFLMRKNGVKGILKKGMSVSSHFMITRRSLFDLLYQKMDDWANPTQYNISTEDEKGN